MSNATELLREALGAMRWANVCVGPNELCDDIEDFLAAEKEAEPVAWTNYDELDCLKEDVTCYMYAEPWGDRQIPLYTRPDPNPSESIKNQEVDRSRKPMTPKERSDSYIELEETIGPDAHLLSFLSGIAAAERYHGIETKDPEPSGDYVLGEGSPYFEENK